MTRQIEVSDDIWTKIKDIVKADDKSWEINSMDDFIGKQLFIRTVTYHLTGRVKARIGKFFHLEDAAWIADSGRFEQAIKDGELDEVEPVEECWVNIDSITDMFPYNHKLPRKQK
jgi:hypothetical protein